MIQWNSVPLGMQIVLLWFHLLRLHSLRRIGGHNVPIFRGIEAKKCWKKLKFSDDRIFFIVCKYIWHSQAFANSNLKIPEYAYKLAACMEFEPLNDFYRDLITTFCVRLEFGLELTFTRRDMRKSLLFRCVFIVLISHFILPFNFSTFIAA